MLAGGLHHFAVLMDELCALDELSGEGHEVRIRCLLSKIENDKRPGVRQDIAETKSATLHIFGHDMVRVDAVDGTKLENAKVAKVHLPCCQIDVDGVVGCRIVMSCC